jgi:hypothetical protein
MSWVLGIGIIALAYLLVETVVLRRASRDIPCRLVVTGTRGKSSLVKVLLAGIRQVEPAAWGKITGDVPLVLAPDGTSRRIARRGPAHLREQAKFLINCRRQRAQCVVVESMAISPESMAAEMRLIRPTMVIVTNVRDDHRETLGDDRDQQRTAYLAALPRGCRWLTLDPDLLAFRARSKRYPLPEFVSAGDVVRGRGESIDVIPEISATAEAALDLLGWNSEPVRRALQAAAIQAVAPPRRVLFLGREFTLLDAFSANDPLSLSGLWEKWRREGGDVSNWSVLLNTRADRPLRTRQFCRWLADRGGIDEIFVAGSHRWAAARLLRGWKLRVTKLSAGTPEIKLVPGGAAGSPENGRILVGIGNIAGLERCLRETGGKGIL